MKVFLGGTCNGDSWREQLTKMITCDYFNRKAEDWNENEEEDLQKFESDILLYVITSKTKSAFAIAEAVISACDRPEATIFCVLAKGFSSDQKKSLEATAKLIRRKGASVCYSINEASNMINFMNQKMTRDTPKSEAVYDLPESTL